MRIWMLMFLLVPAFAGCLGGEEDLDSDGDGLSDAEEQRLGTDPHLADSDGDGIDDGSEVDDGKDPLDATIIPGPTGPFSAFGEALSIETHRGVLGIWVHDARLYQSNGDGLAIYSLQDSSDPVFLGNISFGENADGDTVRLSARDVDVLEWDGRLYAALADGGRGIHIIDVTDPTAPVYKSTAAIRVHNLAAVEGTPYIYSATAHLPAGQVQTVDITDPSEPVIRSFAFPPNVNGVAVTSDGCHDITVRMDLGRAYCGGAGSRYITGGGESFVWDISQDPLDPVWVTAVDDPRIVYHHQAFPSQDGNLLIVNDEYIGDAYVGVTGANNCQATDAPGDTSEDQYPIAAAWIWDISDPTLPVLLSHIQNDAGWDGEGAPANPTEGNCGSHFGDLVDGQQAFVMGWHQGGTILVDFEDPEHPFIMDRLGPVGSTWEARYFNGHVYHASGDLLVTPLQ